MKRISAVCVLLILCVALAGCGKSKDIEETPELLPAAGVASDIFTVVRGNNYVPVVHDAAVVAYKEELSLERNATVLEVLVTEGERVKEGQLLISLDLETTREKAEKLEESIAYTEQINEIDVSIAQMKIDRLKNEYAKLAAEGADDKTLELKQFDIRQAELDLKHTKDNQAANLAESRESLRKLYETLESDGIYSPCDGVISSVINLKKGSRITAFDTVITVSDDSRLSIETEYISDSVVNAATGGIYAHIGANKYEVSRVPIDMTDYLSVVLAGGTVTCNFDIVGPEGWENEVSAGDYCALVFINNYAEDRVLIPSNSFLNDSDSRYVYVVGEHGERVRRDVRLKTNTNAIYAEVLEGLEPGERIYITDK